MIGEYPRGSMADKADEVVCPNCGLECIEKARIDEFYSPKPETKVFCEDEHFVYLHEV